MKKKIIIVVLIVFSIPIIYNIHIKLDKISFSSFDEKLGLYNHFGEDKILNGKKIKFSKINIDFNLPVGLIKNNNNISVIEQVGYIRKLSNHNILHNLQDRVASPIDNWEHGLLGYEFNKEKEFFIFSYVPKIENNQYFLKISKSENYVNQDTNLEDLYEFKREDKFHHGGRLQYYKNELYLGIGDGEDKTISDSWENPNGSILKLNLENKSFEILSKGLRNPWGWGFDKNNDNLWVGDVGDNDWEELNLIEIGKNYGYPNWEGSLCIRKYNFFCLKKDFKDPHLAHNHKGDEKILSITGGPVYRGKNQSINGLVLYAGFLEGSLYGYDYKNYKIYKLFEDINVKISSISIFDDDIYLTDYNGLILKSTALD